MANRRRRSDSNNSDNDTVAYIVAEPLELDADSSYVFPADNPTVLGDLPATPGRPVASAWPISEPFPLEVNAMPLEDIEDSNELSFSSSYSGRSTGVSAAGEAVIRRVNIGGGPVNVLGSSDILQAASQHRHRDRDSNGNRNYNPRNRIVTAEPEMDTTIRRVNIAGGPVNIIGPSDLLRENESYSHTTSNNPPSSSMNRPERRRTFGHDGEYDRFRRTGNTATATTSTNASGVNRLERPSSHAPSRYQVQSLNIGGERVNILTLTPDDEEEDDIYAFSSEQPNRSGRGNAVPSSVTVAAQREALRAGARNRPPHERAAPVDTAIRTVTIGGAPVNIVGGYNPAYSTLPTARTDNTRNRVGGTRTVSSTEPVAIARAYTELYDSRPVNPVVRRVNIGGQPVNILQSSDQLSSRDRLPSFNEQLGSDPDSDVRHQLFERRPTSSSHSSSGSLH